MEQSKEITGKKSNRIFVIVMAGLLLLQLLALFYYGGRKEGYHEDELYTYYSSNKTAGLFVNDRQWMTRDELRNDFVVLPGEQFRYNVVKQMQSWDVHPPLYYYIFHTACSFFPNLFSKWLGISINIIAYVLSYLLLAYCAYTAATQNKVTDAAAQDQASKGKRLAFLTCLTWGLSSAVISGVLFIRMYQWLTVFILLCAALHLRAMKKQDFRIRSFLLPLAITVFLGFMTQYYYLIFHFFMGAGFCFYLFRKKRIKELFSYAAACAVGLGAAICYYPASLSHIFRGYRGTEAVTEFSNAGNTWERLQFFYGLFDDYVMNGTLSWWLLILCLLAVTAGYLKKRKAESDGVSGKTSLLSESIGLLLFTCAGYFFTISKTALLLGETSNRYQLPIYGLLLFLLLYATWILLGGFLARKPQTEQKDASKVQTSLFAGMLVLLLAIDGMALAHGKVFFLYEEEKPIMEYVKSNTDVPVVVFYNEASSEKIWWLSNELMEFPEVYLASQGNSEEISDERINDSNHVLVYVADYENQTKCLDALLKTNHNLQEYQVAYEKNGWNLYELR